MSEATTRDRLIREIEAHSAGFEFVQLVRLLQRLRPDRAPIGEWADPGSEIVRFHVPPSLAFPVGEVAEVQIPSEPAADRPARVGVRFLGLTGPQGVLPHVYTEHAASRVRARDHTFRDFLDLFHHRVLSLFYRSWERHRPMVAAEHGGEDRMRAHLLDLVGAGTPTTQAQSPLPPAAMAYYAGLFALRTRPAVALAQLVSHHFGVPAEVEQFVGEWRALDHGGQCCLGDEQGDGILGQAVIGNAVYDAHARVRLRLGPLTRAQFDAFLPDGGHHARLRALATYFTDGETGVEVQLVLARDETPAATLGETDAPRLAMGSWLRTRPVTRDPDDVLLTLC